MDFKDRYPVPPMDLFRKLDPFRPDPYDQPDADQPLEFSLPDLSESFLCHHCFAIDKIISPDDEHKGISYLIEASRNCPMRQAFEYGEISWSDYWQHKGWLVEMTTSHFGGQIDRVRYIKPHEMRLNSKKDFERLQYQGPRFIKLAQLELGIKYSSWPQQRDENIKARRKYDEYIKIHGERLLNNKIAA